MINNPLDGKMRDIEKCKVLNFFFISCLYFIWMSKILFLAILEENSCISNNHGSFPLFADVTFPPFLSK